jgi:glycosyltransferase involved in cell wall biosynthesis
MRRLKIVHIVQSLETGGAEKLLVDLSLNCKHDYDVTVISQYRENGYPYEKILRENDIKIVYLDKKKGFDINNLIDLTKSLKEIKPDIIHTHLHSAIYAIPYYFNNKKCAKIHTIHSIAKMEFDKVHRLIQSFAYKFLGVTPVAIGETVKETIMDEYRINDIRVIHNGIDLKKYSISLNVKTKHDAFVIVNVASFSKWKNQMFLLEAFNNALKMNNRLKLIFVGGGPLKKDVEKRAIEYGIYENTVKFIGVSDDVPKYLSEADIFCLCSTFEGFPISMLEAFDAGLPVISTDVGGVKDILIDGENGILVESNNIEQLENAILKLAHDIELCNKISQTNIKKAKKFNIKETTKSYIKLYHEKLGEYYA